MFPVFFVLLFLSLDGMLWFAAWDSSFFSYTFTSCQASAAEACAFKSMDKERLWGVSNPTTQSLDPMMIPICPGRFTESLQELGTVGAFPLMSLGACKWLCRKIPATLQRWMDFGVTLTEVLTLGFRSTHPGLSVGHDIPLPLCSRKRWGASVIAQSHSPLSRGTTYPGTLVSLLDYLWLRHL